MPGPEKSSLPAGKEETEQVKRGGMRKVRVICTDPDATESSSDEQDEELQKGSFRKRVVREMLIPAMSSSREAAEESSRLARSIRDCSSTQPQLPNRKNLSKTSCKRSPKKWRLRRMGGMPTRCRSPLRQAGKKACGYKGVRQRRWGKWTAELRESSQGVRMWLGTFDSAREAAIAYDDAARQLKGSEAVTNFGASFPTCSGFSSQNAQLGPLIDNGNDCWAGAGTCEDDNELLLSEDDNELLLSCIDLKAMEDCLLAYSPSSVLDQPDTSDIGLLMSSPSSVLESTFADDCAYDGGAINGKAGEDCHSSSLASVKCVDESHKIVSPAMASDEMELDGMHKATASLENFFETFEKMYENQCSNFACEVGSAYHDVVPQEDLSEGEEANLLSFELDAEALTWINIQP